VATTLTVRSPQVHDKLSVRLPHVRRSMTPCVVDSTARIETMTPRADRVFGPLCTSTPVDTHRVSFAKKTVWCDEPPSATSSITRLTPAVARR
jgi:hypothetical protein